MSEYLHVEKPFLEQLAALGWQVVNQGVGIIPSDPAPSLRASFREWLLPEVFRNAVRAINETCDGRPWSGPMEPHEARSGDCIKLTRRRSFRQCFMQ